MPIYSVRGTLQLLLLADYICDWGRDKFRESTIQSLAAFSLRKRQGTAASEIFSMRAMTATPAPASRSSTMSARSAMTLRIPQPGSSQQRYHRPGRYLDQDEQEQIASLTLRRGLCRDIQYITSRSRGVLITKENLDLLRNHRRLGSIFRDLLLISYY